MTFEIDFDKLAGEHLTVDLGFLGLNLRLHQFIRDNEHGEKLRKETENIKTIEEVYKEEARSLKAQIKILKAQLKQ